MRLALIVAAALALIACPAKKTEHEGTLHRDQTFEHDGTTRTYHFYEPARREGARPLVLVLHGGGGTIDNTIGLGTTRWPHQVWLDLADAHGLFVLVTQGIATQWHDCRAECERCGEADDEGFLLALLDSLAASHDVDPRRVYVVGESNGGFMAQRLAQEAPERFAAMGIVISLLPAHSDCAPQGAPMSLMYQVGTADQAVPYDGGSNDEQIVVLSAEETVAYWRGVNGCAAAPTTRTYDDLDPDDGSTVTRSDYACPATGTALSLVTIAGAGHVPASIEVRVTSFWEGMVGEQNHDIESARLFWEFFDARSGGQQE